MDAPTPPPESRLDAADAALADALRPSAGALTLAELADRAEAPLALLEAMQREGLLLADADGARFTEEDAAAVRAGLALVDSGVPLAELLELARAADKALRGIADQAVDVFLRFVRDQVLGASDDDETADQLVGAFERMLPATEAIVAHHFRQLVVAAARERMARELAEE